MNALIPNWKVPSCVKAVASTRLGGFSLPPYEGLNLGTHVGDETTTVMKNREQFIQDCSMPASPIWLNQTHSTHVVDVSQPTLEILNADGVSTRAPNVVCSAMTADCLPVLLTNSQGSQVAAVHAGWRGLSGGILENAVAQFEEPSEVIAWLGPAIGSNAFEVGEDVLKAFISVDDNAHKAFIPHTAPNKWLANMDMLATQRLNRVGVKSVYSSNLCTYEREDQFYSYRRDGVTGRQAVFIWIEGASKS
ncbi:peptidoglycan editing factor PgeF [uncultured Vibrio sp.]|uniref:peptidoglycan editing factor PgeF n=1 Tax=uncultured Vibrio sp. TaxID=114054 RepID=UPI000911DF1D|nr:peptidoglycan editing factor PgeF [uncultured Vibrio sp.]OIQ24426.1 MAG: multi-copper polyphenol oxidoreductase [Vibrio sp. MedPE-SWchi]